LIIDAAGISIDGENPRGALHGESQFAPVIFDPTVFLEFENESVVSWLKSQGQEGFTQTVCGHVEPHSTAHLAPLHQL